MAKLSTFLKMLGPEGRVDGNYKYLPIYFRSIPGLKKGEWSSHVRNKNCLLEEEKISNALNSHFNFFFSFNNNKYSVYMECASISFSSSYKLNYLYINWVPLFSNIITRVYEPQFGILAVASFTIFTRVTCARNEIIMYKEIFLTCLADMMWFIH